MEGSFGTGYLNCYIKVVRYHGVVHVIGLLRYAGESIKKVVPR